MITPLKITLEPDIHHLLWAENIALRRPKRHSVEELRRSSFIAFGGQGQAGLSPGGQAEACPTWDIVPASEAQPGRRATP
jgi:hypothetical protein